MTTDVAMLILRVVVGGIVFAHGARKLFGWFGGNGLEGATGFMENLGLPAPRLQAVLAASAETFGGLAVVLGLFPRLGAVLVTGTMVMAILAVHLENGFWNTNGGYEFNLTLLTGAIVAAWAPGQYALSTSLGWPILSAELFLGGLVAAVVFDVVNNQARETEPSAAAA